MYMYYEFHILLELHQEVATTDRASSGDRATVFTLSSRQCTRHPTPYYSKTNNKHDEVPYYTGYESKYEVCSLDNDETENEKRRLNYRRDNL